MQVKMDEIPGSEAQRVHFLSLFMKKVYLETFGCQMNVSDSERVATSLQSKGFEITTQQESADIVLINTCSVRE